MEEKSFLGRGWAFPPTFSKNQKGIELVAAVEDINQSLHILLSTSLGERIMQPEYGCNLKDYLFEPMNTSLIGLIYDLVRDAILYHEPRIRVENITISESDSQDAIEGLLLIGIDYVIRESNSRFNFVFDFYLREGVG